MPRHSTSVSHSGGALMHKSRGAGLRSRQHPAEYSGAVDMAGLYGSGLRARQHPAEYSGAVDMGSLRGGGFSVSGGSGASNPWIHAVKMYAEKHGCSYGEALSGASASYQKGRN